jgi:hypothetical protein
MKLRVTKTLRMILLSVLTCTVLTANCSFTNDGMINSKERHPKTDAHNPVENICELMKNPQKYDKQVVRVRTRFGFAPGPTFGDDQCTPRHSLIDVEFSDTSLSRICDNDSLKKKHCKLIQQTRKGQTDNLRSFSAEFVGQFELVRSDTGFTAGGFRYRFVVSEIKNADPTEQIQKETVQ